MRSLRERKRERISNFQASKTKSPVGFLPMNKGRVESVQIGHALSRFTEYLDGVGPGDVLAVAAALLVVDNVKERAALHEIGQQIGVVGGDGHSNKLGHQVNRERNARGRERKDARGGCWDATRGPWC